MKLTLLVICLTLTAASSAEPSAEHEDIVRRAFESIDHRFADSWAYTEKSTEEDVVRIGRYDPRYDRGERWSLISVDGRQPSEEEVEDYLDDKDNNDDRQHEDETGEDGERTVGIDVNFETLDLVEETNEHWIFSFIPDEDDDEEFMKHVSGHIKVIKQGHYVEYIDVRNKKPIKPAIGVKIKKFRTRLEFGPAADGGPIVPLAVDVEVQGRAMLVIKFDEKESVRFSDFEYAVSD
jgi:hypothetical protein